MKDGQKGDAFKIAKRFVKTNLGVIDEQFIRNDDFVLSFSDEVQKIV